MRAQTEQSTPKTTEMRERLKVIMNRELDRLADTLEAMQPVDRINVVIKLMPFVFPKVDAVNYRNGEPKDWEF